MSARGQSRVVKVILLGDGGVGKTCLMTRFVHNKYDEQTYHTIGVEFLTREVELNGVHYTLQIWDTAGQERFKSLRTPFYRGSDICVFVFALDDAQSFENLATWKREFVKYADIDDEHSFPFIVIGNKSDLESADWRVTQDKIDSWLKEENNNEPSGNNTASYESAGHSSVQYFPASAKTADKVENAFIAGLRRFADFEQLRDTLERTAAQLQTANANRSTHTDTVKLTSANAQIETSASTSGTRRHNETGCCS